MRILDHIANYIKRNAATTSDVNGKLIEEALFQSIEEYGGQHTIEMREKRKFILEYMKLCLIGEMYLERDDVDGTLDLITLETFKGNKSYFFNELLYHIDDLRKILKKLEEQS